jgi:hypothetical protein
MHTRKIGIMMPVAIVISMVFGVILAARGTLDFLGNVTEGGAIKICWDDRKRNIRSIR